VVSVLSSLEREGQIEAVFRLREVGEFGGTQEDVEQASELRELPARPKGQTEKAR
jgi:hypothetical protein